MSTKNEEVSSSSTVTTQGSSASSQPHASPGTNATPTQSNTPTQNQETANQSENQEKFTQPFAGNNVPNGNDASLNQESSNPISGTQIATSTPDAPLTDVKRSEPDSSSHGAVESTKSEFQPSDQQSHKPANNEQEEEDMLVTVKQELIEPYVEPDPFSVLSDAPSDMDIDVKSDTEDDEEEREGYMRHFYCYFCLDDVMNEKIDQCKFCRPIWSSDKLCQYDEDALGKELRGFIPDYKEGRCIICFQLVSDAGLLCNMCKTNIDKALY